MSDQSHVRVAFVGLGNMGGPMAANLARAGYAVAGFDISDDARERAGAAGVRVVGSVSHAIADASAVVSMLPASRHVEDLYLGSDGVMARLPADTLIIDSSTIAPASAQRIAAAAASRGVRALDAPVSGGTAGAAAGTLTFMVGGEADDVTRATPLLEAMGANVLHAGGPGAGQAAKLCNNMLLAILMIGTAEALSLGETLGLDPKTLSDVMRRSSGGNWVLEKYNPVPSVMEAAPASRGYSGGFATELMLKDLGLAIEAAVAHRSAVPMGGLARALYAMHANAGHGALDFSSIITLVAAGR